MLCSAGEYRGGIPRVVNGLLDEGAHGVGAGIHVLVPREDDGAAPPTLFVGRPPEDVST